MSHKGSDISQGLRALTTILTETDGSGNMVEGVNTIYASGSGFIIEITHEEVRGSVENIIRQERPDLLPNISVTKNTLPFDAHRLEWLG